MKTKPGVMLFFESLVFLDQLNDSQRGKLFTAIVRYARDGEVPEFKNQILKLAWDFVRPGLDRDEERYRNICEKNRANAEKRWQKKADACDGMPITDTKTKSKTIQSQSHSQSQSPVSPRNDLAQAERILEARRRTRREADPL